MAAAAVLSAVGSVLGGLTGAFGNQTRAGAAAGVSSRHVDTSTAAIATAATPKAARSAARNADKERIMALLTDPQVMGLLTVLGGLAVSTRIPFHSDPGTNARLQGIAASSCVLMGLGRAGVGDLTTLAFAGAAGLTVAGSSGVEDLIPNIPGTDIPAYYALMPAGGVAWAIRELAGQS